jgi:hypothetical protein
MRIANSYVNNQATSTSVNIVTAKLSVSSATASKRLSPPTSAPDGTVSEKTEKGLNAPQDELAIAAREEFAKQAEELQRRQQEALNQRFRMQTGQASPLRAISDPKTEIADELTLLERMVSAMLGRKFRFTRADMSAFNQQQRGLDGSTGPNVVVSQQEVNFSYERYSAQSMEFKSQGTVQTSDGRTIEFDLSLSMSQEQYERMDLSMQQKVANFVDPLVIQMNGSAPGLTKDKYSFDLNADGVMDNISFVENGGGFLSLDKNGDGVINDGTELFGVKSGDGFGELAQFDEDGNGWIDENDDVFSKLTVWTKNENGEDILLGLLEADVGAIYLGDVGSEYTLNGENGTNGQMRSSSVYLKEKGGAGSIHHIDLAL